MQCTEIQEALLEAQYNSQPLASGVQKHVASCDACQALHAASQNLDEILALDNEPPALRPGFDTRFFARLEEVKEAEANKGLKGFFGKFQWWITGAMAGATALALVMITQPTLQEDVLFDPDLTLAMELEMVEDLDLLAQLDEVEDFDIVAQLNVAELDSLDGGKIANEESGEVRVQ